mmetsp:Transcript_184258/g.584252  ORF Transcript_184258/g.584252 Transcript_184258/m.584252 type:complete len:252 (-) Transcript_184258:183-938(-)
MQAVLGGEVWRADHARRGRRCGYDVAGQAADVEERQHVQAAIRGGQLESLLHAACAHYEAAVGPGHKLRLLGGAGSVQQQRDTLGDLARRPRNRLRHLIAGQREEPSDGCIGFQNDHGHARRLPRGMLRRRQHGLRWQIGDDEGQLVVARRRVDGREAALRGDREERDGGLGAVAQDRSDPVAAPDAEARQARPAAVQEQTQLRVRQGLIKSLSNVASGQGTSAQDSAMTSGFSATNLSSLSSLGASWAVL